MSSIPLSVPGVDWAKLPLHTTFDELPPERPDFRVDKPTCSLAVWTYVVPPSMMQHAALLDRDGWMRENKRAYRALPPHPSNNQVLGKLTVSHDAPAGASAVVSAPLALDGGVHLRYDDAVGVTLSDETRLLAFYLVHSNGSPELTG